MDQFYDQPHITYTDTVGRNGKQFEPWEKYRNESNKPKIRRTIRQYTRFSFKATSNITRHDEPELAAFVYADSFDTIENYLVGPPRQPFYRPRGHFIIIVTQNAQIDWMESAAAIVETLWRDYRVFNVIIMVPCEGNQVCSVHSYKYQINLFVGNRSLGFSIHSIQIQILLWIINLKIIGVQ